MAAAAEFRLAASKFETSYIVEKIIACIAAYRTRAEIAEGSLVISPRFKLLRRIF
jgi:hypothetical protein